MTRSDPWWRGVAELEGGAADRPAAAGGGGGGGRGVATPAVSLVCSLAVHAIVVLVGAAAVVWRSAGVEAPRGPEVTITLEAPTFAEVPVEGPGGEAPPERGPREMTVVMEPAPVEPPARVEPLQGLTSAGAVAEADAPPELDALGPAVGSLLLDAPEGPEGARDVADAVAERAKQREVVFYGLGASSARSVVYVVDCSGPMVTSLPQVLAEVQRSVSRLAPTQKFGVVIFRKVDGGAGLTGGTGTEHFATVLVRATPTAKHRLREWLATVQPSGRSNPLEGLEAGIRLQPDAVFLLSRSIERSGGSVWDQGLQATMARLDAVNPMGAGLGGRRPVQIQTIQFLDEDPTGIMQAIGAQHGKPDGYRVVRRGEEAVAGHGSAAVGVGP